MKALGYVKLSKWRSGVMAHRGLGGNSASSSASQMNQLVTLYKPFHLN